MAGIIGAAFWLFIASIVLGGMWYAHAQNREIQKTIRLALEKDIPLDDALMGKLAIRQSGNPADYYIGGYVCLAVCLGLPILGYFVGLIAPEAFYPIAGAGILIGLVGISLILGGKLLDRREKAVHSGNH
jgi:hypothetical protein